MLGAIGWFILGACAMLVTLIVAGVIIAVIGLAHSPLSDQHYVD